MPINYPLAVLIIIAIYILQTITQSLVRSLNNSVEKLIKSHGSDEKGPKNAEFEREASSFMLFQTKKTHLRYITKIIGYFESFLFVMVTTIILFRGENLGLVLTISGGWIALKIFGNYQQWSSVVLGRALFYIFLIGSLFNIILSILLGVLYYSWY